MKRPLIAVAAALLTIFMDAQEVQMCTAYVDRDGDGYGTDEKTVDFYCDGGVPVGFAAKKGDCNDLNRYINPGVAERCNGIDDNCDRITDPENSSECNSYYKDMDGDGYGIDESKCLCVSEGKFSTLERGDCDDTNSRVFPGVKEICNDLDDNCNGIKMKERVSRDADRSIMTLTETVTDPEMIQSAFANPKVFTGQI
jgi:hypothetical protein